MKHYIVVPLETWGHCRPELTLALRLVQLHPELLISLILPSTNTDKTSSLIADFGLDPSQSDRIRIAHWSFLSPPPVNPLQGNEDDAGLSQLGAWFADNIMPSLKQYLEGDNAFVPSDQSPHAAKPDAIIVDRLITLLPLLRRHAIEIPTYISMIPVPLSFAESVVTVGNSPFDGVLNRYIELTRGGASDEEAFDKTLATSEELLSTSSGLGPMYIREMDPNSTSRWNTQMRGWNGIRSAESGDKLLVFWPSCFSHQHNPRLIPVGPQLSAISQAKPDQNVLRFLDRQTAQSIVYICFGSYSWIPTLDQTKLLFDTLDKLGVGALIIHAVMPVFGAPRPEIESLLRDRIARMGPKAMLTEWTPQIDVLRHEAVLFIISHGGSNTSMECMVTSMPMVMWPGAWDQPNVANELCELGIARELIQVRTGHEVRRRTARGVLVEGTHEAILKEMEEVFGLMASGKSQKLRKRCEEVRKLVVEDMESGISLKNMLALGDL